MSRVLLVGFIALFAACSGGEDVAPAASSTAPASVDVASADLTQLSEISSSFLAEVNALLATIEDGSSAEAAKPGLEALVARMGPIQDRRKELIQNPVPPADPTAFAQSVQGQMDEWKRFMGNLKRLAPKRAELTTLDEPLMRLSGFMGDQRP